MIKKESIKKTAICYWSDDDESYVVESPLFPRTAGIGHTRESAHKHFTDMLDSVYLHLTANKVHGYNKRGRPAKGGIQFHTQVRSKTKSYISEISKKLKISLGEVLDYLCAFHIATNGQEQKRQKTVQPTTIIDPQLIEVLSDLLISRIEQKSMPQLIRESPDRNYKTTKYGARKRLIRKVLKKPPKKARQPG